jgi:hypothetical protein
LARIVEQRGDAVKEGRLPDVVGAEPLDLGALSTSEDDADLDLTALLRLLLFVCNDKRKTWAQQLVEGWIVDGLEGDPRAIVDVLDRAEWRRAAKASATAALPPLDGATASKIVEVLCGHGEGATGD